jgi:DNA-binding winged helix-turn-helix (wHTH) protein/Tfp pilus assembly protein PilF
LNYAAHIDLGQEQDFQLGELSVRPSLRQVVDRTGRSEVVEPRVMQVLVALARANGDILTREALTVLCWDGRIVGEDAINRVMSRLRRLSEGIGGSGFRIETITKVGYRLVLSGAAVAEQSEATPSEAKRKAAFFSQTRRVLLGAGLLGSLGAIGTFAALWGRNNEHVPLPEAAKMIALGHAALCKCNAEGISEAIGLFRRAVEIDPDAVDGWGLLAVAYAYALHLTKIDTVEALTLRTRSSAARAFTLDPHNPFAEAALYGLIPARGHWSEAETSFRTALRRHPDTDHLMFGYGLRLALTGRMRESADLFNRVLRLSSPSSPSPCLMCNQVLSVWGSGSIDEADQAIERAYALFPLHTWIWFTRFYMLMFSGRAREALAMGENVGGRPPDIMPQGFELPMASARALDTQAPKDIETALRMHLEAARQGSGYAENAINFASAVGRLDQAFEVAAAFFFNRGYVVPDLRFDGPRHALASLSERRTTFLFLPPAEAMRRDPRFAALMSDLGLTQFWRETGVTPDYQRA